MNYRGFEIYAHSMRFPPGYYAIGWKTIDGVRYGINGEGATPKRAIKELKSLIDLDPNPVREIIPPKPIFVS